MNMKEWPNPKDFSQAEVAEMATMAPLITRAVVEALQARYGHNPPRPGLVVAAMLVSASVLNEEKDTYDPQAQGRT